MEHQQAEAHADQGTNAAPAMSKRQQKRLAKMERQGEVKRARKAAEKEQKHKALENKREAISTMLAEMTEEERQQWHEKQKEKKQQMTAARQAAKEKQQQALSAPQKVVIDLGFSGLMNTGELKSLCQQLSYSYSIAVNRDQQLHLLLLGADGDLEAALQRQLPGHVHWSATKSDQDFKEFFKDNLQDLVYLTADSPNELSELDSSKIYILGGLVDRNRHKGICYQRAQEAGVATAKLPIAQHIKLHTSAVITVNQVVDIISRMQGQPDWKGVLEAVLPCRKRADGTGSKEASPAPAAAAAQAATATGSKEASPAAAAAAAKAATATGSKEASPAPKAAAAAKGGTATGWKEASPALLTAAAAAAAAAKGEAAGGVDAADAAQNAAKAAETADGC